MRITDSTLQRWLGECLVDALPEERELLVSVLSYWRLSRDSAQDPADAKAYNTRGVVVNALAGALLSAATDWAAGGPATPEIHKVSRMLLSADSETRAKVLLVLEAAGLDGADFREFAEDDVASIREIDFDDVARLWSLRSPREAA